ncbi:hypothetical protein D3C72_2569770 [compost metagenome]
MHGGPVLDVGQRLIEARKVLVAGNRHDIFLEQDVLGLEAGRVDVGHVVGHHIHLPL